MPETHDQVSAELAEQRAHGWINDAKKLFNREEISDQYREFISNAMENIDKLSKVAGGDTAWKKPKLDQAKSPDVRELAREGGITVGKPRATLESALRFDERAKLKKAVDEHGATLTEKIVNRYHDEYNSSIMMSECDTKERNEILRKIKLWKAKKKDLAAFKREERERILAERELATAADGSPLGRRLSLKPKKPAEQPAAKEVDKAATMGKELADAAEKIQAVAVTTRVQEQEHKDRKAQFETFVKDILQKHVKSKNDNVALQKELSREMSVFEVADIINDRLRVKE